MFIFTSNLVGLIPYSFTITSSFIVTFFLALSHFIGINIIGIVERRWEFASLFLPSGVPSEISFLLVPIEFVSYIARVFSLSIRLFANMMSGHALLKILIGFSWMLLGSGILYAGTALLPWAIVTVIMLLELLIAFLQAYVFVILIAIYVNDAITSH
jgi:ATP synthase subunit 6